MDISLQNSTRYDESHPSSPYYIEVEDSEPKYCECGREIYLTNELELNKCCFCIEYERDNE